MYRTNARDDWRAVVHEQWQSVRQFLSEDRLCSLARVYIVLGYNVTGKTDRWTDTFFIKSTNTYTHSADEEVNKKTFKAASNVTIKRVVKAQLTPLGVVGAPPLQPLARQLRPEMPPDCYLLRGRRT